jgi:hypothetical protein
MGRADFHAGLIERILNILVQFGVDRHHSHRLVGIGIDFVGYIKIVECGLQDKRVRRLQNPPRGKCGGN